MDACKGLIAFNEIRIELVTSVHEIHFLRVHEGINNTTMEPKILKFVPIVVVVICTECIK